VEFRDVTKTYNAGEPNAFTAIRNVTFAVEDLVDKGEFVCVLGPSGCGKSTILRLIAGLEPQHPPTEGDVLVMGQTVAGPGADRGMVFQDYTSFDHRTVLDNVTFGLECQGVPRRVRDELGREWIEQVGLNVDEDAEKYPHELSGGMRQRVAIAMSLVTAPGLIILDEPTSALDVLTQANIMNVLKRIKKELGVSFILITHDIATSSELADKVAVMYAGQIVEVSDAQQFFTEPLHPYSRKLMASVPRLRAEVEPEFITGQPPSLLNPPKGCSFADRCTERFEKCDQDPPVVRVGNREVKCWLHVDGEGN